MNSVFIATSIDGCIADKNGGIDWLHSIPNPDNNDMGYSSFMERIDAIIMGRKTFETVLGFDMDWPYNKPVFVLSNTMNKIPKELEKRVFIVGGPLKTIIENINQQGYQRLYIDGGTTIQSFLKEDLIDEFIITRIPILLGGGTLLFSEHSQTLAFNLKSTKTYLKEITQTQYTRSK